MKYPTSEFLLELHTYLMHDVWHETFFGPHRLELLESALAGPRQAAAYADADGILQSAYLFHGRASGSVAAIQYRCRHRT